MNDQPSLLKRTWTWLTDNFARTWFLFSSVALAALYFMAAKRGRELNELHRDAQRSILAQKVTDIKAQSELSQEDYQNAQKSYEDLRRIHGDLLGRLGIPITSSSGTDTTH